MTSEINNRVVSVVGVQQQNTRINTDTLPASQDGNNLPDQASDLPALAKEESSEISSEALQQAADSLNEFMQARKRSLQFSQDDVSGRTVIKVINTDTKEVVRQYPPEEILSLSRTITESLAESIDFSSGLLLEERG